MIEPNNNNICEINVGGKAFTFSKSTFEQSHLKDSIIAKTALRRINDMPPFFDVDPQIFIDWCAPYIRHGLLPTAEGLETLDKKNCLIDTANSIGLLTLAEHVNENLPNQKIRIGFTVKNVNPDPYTRPYISLFNSLRHCEGIDEIACPIKECNIKFRRREEDEEEGTEGEGVSDFLAHFLGSPHNGKMEIFEVICGQKIGSIELEATEVREQELNESGYNKVVIRNIDAIVQK